MNLSGTELRRLQVVGLLLIASGLPAADGAAEEKPAMSTTGTFEVSLKPQEDADYPAGRMLIAKTYSGGLVGSGTGQMISKRTEGGAAVYHAIEEFEGSLDGKSGGFTLVHSGFMDKETQSLEVVILEGSGTGDLATIRGSMAITQGGGGHSYELSYEL